MTTTEQLLGQHRSETQGVEFHHEILQTDMYTGRSLANPQGGDDNSSAVGVSAEVVFRDEIDGHTFFDRQCLEQRDTSSSELSSLGPVQPSLPSRKRSAPPLDKIDSSEVSCTDSFSFRGGVEASSAIRQEATEGIGHQHDAERTVTPRSSLQPAELNVAQEEEDEEDEDEESPEPKLTKRELHEFLEERYVLLAQQGRTPTLDRQKAEVSTLLASASISEVLQLSKPITYATANKVVRAAFVVIGLLLLYWFGAAVYARFHSPEHDVRFLRFTALELREGTLEARPGAHVQEFGALAKFCKVEGGEESREEGLHRVTVRYDKVVRINGWYYITAADEPALDPVRFSVEGSLDGAEFFDIGTDMWRLNFDGSVYSVKALNRRPPTERGKKIDLSIVPWWPWNIRVFGKFFVPAAGLLGCSALASVKGGETQRLVLVGAFLASSGVLLSTACAYIYISQAAQSFLDWTFSVLQLGLGLVLWRREATFIPVMCVALLLYPCAHFLEEALMTDFDDPQRKVYAIAVGLFAVPVMGVFVLLRQRQLRRKARALAPWQAKFAARWEEVAGREAEADALKRLKGLSNMLNSSVSDRHSRKALLQRTHKDLLPVSNLDQLYSQAAGVQFLLKRKVLKWARDWSGKLRLTERATLAEQPPEYRGAREEGAEGLEWVKLKDPRRAVEKMLKVHGGEVATLLDVCRARIVFERLRDLAECVSAVLNDTTVEVERMHSMMDSGDARVMGGVRMVRMKLRVVSKESKMLGVDEHVAELQLILRPLDELLSADFHRHFVDFSDALRLSQTWNLADRLSSLCACASLHPRRRASAPRTLHAADSSVPWGNRRRPSRQVTSPAHTLPSPMRRPPHHQRTSLQSDDGFLAKAEIARSAGAAPGSWRSRSGWASWKSWARRMSDGVEAEAEAEEETLLGIEIRAALGEQGSSLSSKRREVLIEQYRVSVQAPSGHLDKRVRSANTAMLSANSASVFHTSMPIAAALTKRWFRWFLLIIGLIFCLQAVLQAIFVVSGFRSEPVLVRFTPLELREAALEQFEPLADIRELGLLLDGCRVPLPGSASLQADGQSVVLVLGEAVAANGWFFVPGGDERRDPVRFTLTSREAGERGEERRGASGLFVSDSGEFRFSPDHRHRYAAGWSDDPREHLAYAAGGDGATRVPQRFDYRVPWQFGVRVLSVNLIGVMTAWGAAGCGYVKRQFLGKQLLVLGTGLAALMLVVSAAGYGGVGRWRESFMLWMLAVGNGAFSALLLVRETFIMQQTLLVGPFVVMAAVLENTVMDYEPWAITHPRRSMPITGLVLTAIGVLVAVQRRRVLGQSKAVIGKDIEKYNEAWEMVRAEQREGLGRLGELAHQIQARAEGPQRTGSGQRLSVQERVWSVGKRVSTTLTTVRNMGGGASQRETPRERLSSGKRERLNSGRSTGSESRGSEEESAGEGAGGTGLAGTGEGGAAEEGGRGGSRLSSKGSRLAAALSGAGRRQNSDKALSLAQLTLEVAGLEAGKEGGGNSTAREHTPSLESPPASGGPGRVSSLGAGLESSRRRRLSTSHVTHLISSLLSSKQHHEYNLDALYAQAAALHVELADRVQRWALEGGGLVPVEPARELREYGSGRMSSSSRHLHRRRSSQGAPADPVKPQFLPLADTLDDPRLLRRVKLAKLKRPERAIEKLVRSYHRDVSKLTDICRNAIVFASVDDLYHCLCKIVVDPEVVLGRIKNRLAMDYDAPSLSAGYRDVALNLCIQSEWTVALGISEHVCELQLILKDFAELKNAEGHKRYVELRNARGE